VLDLGGAGDLGLVLGAQALGRRSSCCSAA
jgi:hypothetical protein